MKVEILLISYHKFFAAKKLPCSNIAEIVSFCLFLSIINILNFNRMKHFVGTVDVTNLIIFINSKNCFYININIYFLDVFEVWMKHNKEEKTGPEIKNSNINKIIKYIYSNLNHDFKTIKLINFKKHIYCTF